MARFFMIMTCIIFLGIDSVDAQDGGSFGWSYSNDDNSKKSQTTPVRRSDAGLNSSHPVKPRILGEERPMTDSPVYHHDNIYGAPTHMDPLFSQDTTPSWNFGIVREPEVIRPEVEKPNYEAPLMRQEQIQRPTLNRPGYTAPNEDRPRYIYDYDRAPAARLSGAVEPSARAPLYDEHNYTAPAYDKEDYSRSDIITNRPEYNEPVYRYDEYRAPREEAVPYVKPQ